MGLAHKMVQDLVEIPVENALEVVEVLVQAIVRDPGLREVVGPDLLAPLAGADLGTPVVGDLGLPLALGENSVTVEY